MAQSMIAVAARCTKNSRIVCAVPLTTKQWTCSLSGLRLMKFREASSPTNEAYFTVNLTVVVVAPDGPRPTLFLANLDLGVL